MLYEVAKPFNYVRVDIGDPAIKVYALPRVPIILVLWSGEEGIPPKADTLFDKTAPHYLGENVSDVCEAAMGLARTLTGRLVLLLAKRRGFDVSSIEWGEVGYLCAD